MLKLFLLKVLSLSVKKLMKMSYMIDALWPNAEYGGCLGINFAESNLQTFPAIVCT